MMFELGNRMPRITWLRDPFTCAADAAGAAPDAGADEGAGALLEHDIASNEITVTVRTRIDGTSRRKSRKSLLARRSDRQDRAAQVSPDRIWRNDPNISDS